MLLVTLALAADPVPCDKPTDKPGDSPVSLLVLPEAPAAQASVLVVPETQSETNVAAPVLPIVPVAVAPVTAAPKDETCKVKPKK